MATTVTAGVTGRVTIGTPASKEVNIAIDPVTQTFTKHLKGRTTTAAASATVEIPRGTMSDIALIWLKCVTLDDEAIQDNVSVLKLTIGGSPITFPPVGVFLHICNPKSEEDISKVEVVENATTALVIEHLIAGA